MPIVSVSEALEHLKQGTPVALPTETVYGLAAPIHNLSALEAVFELKKRPSFDPLIVHVSSLGAARPLARWDSLSLKLAEMFWPGPLTLILPKTNIIQDIITSGGPTVGLRSPKQAQFLKILEELGSPLAAPSANQFGRTSPTTAEHVDSEFHGKVPIVDGGPCTVGIESTVIRVTDPEIGNLEILRPGGVTNKELKLALQSLGFQNGKIKNANSEASPGHLKNHYQPSAPVVLIDKNQAWDSDLEKRLLFELGKNLSISLEDIGEMSSEITWSWLKLPENPALAARCLYQQLRELSAGRPTAILCHWDSSKNNDGIWQGISDRLHKACSFRIEKNLHEGTIIYSKEQDAGY